MTKLRLEINNNPYNFMNHKTINKNRAAIKLWLTYKAKTEFLPQIDDLFIVNASINYAQRAEVAENDEQVTNKPKYKYVDYDLLVKEVVSACKYKVVSVKKAREITGKTLKKLGKEGVELIKRHKRISKVILRNPDEKEVLFRKAVLLTALTTGARASELVWAYTKGVSDKDIQVLGKRFKIRKPLLNEVTFEVLKEYVRVFEKKPEDRLFVFPGEYNEERNESYNVRISQEYVRERKKWEGLQLSIKEYYYVKRQAFLMNRLFDELFTLRGKHLTPHMMRHSLATHLANNDVSLEVIKELLGHSDLKTTQIYAKIKPQRITEQYDKVMNK